MLSVCIQDCFPHSDILPYITKDQQKEPVLLSQSVYVHENGNDICGSLWEKSKLPLRESRHISLIFVSGNYLVAADVCYRCGNVCYWCASCASSMACFVDFRASRQLVPNAEVVKLCASYRCCGEPQPYKNNVVSDSSVLYRETRMTSSPFPFSWIFST